MPSKALLTAALLAASAVAHADAALQAFLEQTLAATRDKDQFPAAAAVVQIDGRIEAEAALGVRALGHPEPVTVNDRWHIGSDTKAITATMIAGAIAEARTGKTWEDLIREQVFSPLGITNAGFGAPGASGAYDQPRGHLEAAGALRPLDAQDAESDNPPALGPAGTINIALKDWLLFAQDQQNGTPLLLTHTGSNGFWVADIRIMPKHDIIILIASNSGNDAANLAIQDIGKPLRDRLKPFE